MSEAGTLEKRDIVCVFGCVWVCFGVRERERACTFQLHACVFGFEVAAPAQPPPPPSSSSLRPSSQQCQCAWENMWGEEKEEQEGGDPAYLQPVADRSPLVAGQTPKIRYVQYLLWLGSCVPLKDVLLARLVTFLTCNNNPAFGRISLFENLVCCMIVPVHDSSTVSVSV